LLFLFQKLLFENYKYSVDLTNITGLVLTNIFSITHVFSITRSNILFLILFVSRIYSYISLDSFFYYVTKGNGATVGILGWYNRKEGKPWPLGDFSYIVLKS
jgi:hypothetical protein